MDYELRTGAVYGYCLWCRGWGIVMRPSRMDIMICALRIYGIILEMRERMCTEQEIRPPRQPDGRARRASQLYFAKLPANAVVSIAEFEIGQWVP